jgi:capsular exopolysaccharide synthesis family protein
LLGVVGIAAVKFHSDASPSTYISSGRLWVSGKLNVGERSFYTEEVQNFFGTQVELIKSETIRDRARSRVEEKNPDAIPQPVEVRVIQQPKAAIFEVKVLSTDPVYARHFLDGLMESYLAYKTESRTFSSDEKVASLSEQLKAQEEQLTIAQEELRRFQAANNEVVLQERGASVASFLSKQQVQLAEAKLEAQLLESMINAGSPLNKTASSVGFGPEMESLVPGFAGAQQALTPIQQIRFLEKHAEELDRHLFPSHPNVIKLNELIERQKSLLQFFQEQTNEQLASARAALNDKIKGLEASVREWEAKGLEASQKMVEQDRMRDAIAQHQTLYKRVLELLQNVDMSRKLDQENISILQKASAPVPVHVNLPLRMTLGFLLGGLIGLGILYLLERMDDRITSIDNLRGSLGDAKVVGQIPEVTQGRNAAATVLLPGDQRHMFLESYRNIRSSLVFMASNEMRPKSILITSAVPEEGKSTVSVNLAQTLALAGGKVLLIDADLRQGALHQLFNVARLPGLMEVLKGETDLNDAIVPTSRPNLWLLPCGKRGGNPGELLLGSSADNLLEHVSGGFDYIVLDSAPVLAADDTASLAPKVDGVVLVVRESFTRASASQQAIDQLLERQSNVLGVIFNRVNTHRRSHQLYKYAEYHQAYAS